MRKGVTMDALLAGALVAAAWLLWRSPVERAEGQLRALDATFAAEPSLGVILEMMAVAMREGSSIPHALGVIGSIVGGSLGAGLRRASRSLMQGYSWEDAWFAASLACQRQRNRDGRAQMPDKSSGKDDGKPRKNKDGSSAEEPTFDDEALAIIENALQSTWTRGVSPVGPLESAVEQMDARARASIEQTAQRLSVRLLLPTGLCFLPAFMLIGVIPAIGSFMA